MLTSPSLSFSRSVLQNLADRPMKTRYIVATDTSKDTLARITRKVSQTLGNGKVKVVDQEEAMLNRDITVEFLVRCASKDYRGVARCSKPITTRS